MKKLLITGFEPFGGEAINPSWEAVSRLQDVIGDYSVTKLRIPVTFSEAARIAIDKASEIGADVVISVGQAGGRSSVTPELVGINLRHASIPDNAGYQPKDEPINESGREAYFSTLPVRKISEAISSAGISSSVSYSAGAYVCNDVLYTLLAHFSGTETKACFIHIPYVSEQGKEPSMDVDTLVKALTIAIEVI